MLNQDVTPKYYSKTASSKFPYRHSKDEIINLLISEPDLEQSQRALELESYALGMERSSIRLTVIGQDKERRLHKMKGFSLTDVAAITLKAFYEEVTRDACGTETTSPLASQSDVDQLAERFKHYFCDVLGLSETEASSKRYSSEQSTEVIFELQVPYDDYMIKCWFGDDAFNNLLQLELKDGGATFTPIVVVNKAAAKPINARKEPNQSNIVTLVRSAIKDRNIMYESAARSNKDLIEFFAVSILVLKIDINADNARIRDECRSMSEHFDNIKYAVCSKGKIKINDEVLQNFKSAITTARKVVQLLSSKENLSKEIEVLTEPYKQQQSK